MLLASADHWFAPIRAVVPAHWTGQQNARKLLMRLLLVVKCYSIAPAPARQRQSPRPLGRSRVGALRGGGGLAPGAADARRSVVHGAYLRHGAAADDVAVEPRAFRAARRSSG